MARIPNLYQGNAASDAFDAQEERYRRSREQRQKQAIDEALRGGIQDIRAGGDESVAGQDMGQPVQQPDQSEPWEAPDTMQGGALLDQQGGIRQQAPDLSDSGRRDIQQNMQPPQQRSPAGMQPQGGQGGGQRGGWGQLTQTYDPIIDRLAGVEGGGATALQLQQSQWDAQRSAQEQQDKNERIAIEALGKGDMPTFRYFQQKTGLNLDEGIVQNAKLRGLFARGASLADKFYGDDPAQAQQFLSAFMQSDGNPMTAWQTAGAPRSRPNVNLRTIMHEDQNVLARFSDGGQFLGYVTDAEGQPIRDAGGSSGDAPADVRTAQWLVQSGVAGNESEAWNLVRSSRSNPQQARTQIFRSMMSTAEESLGYRPSQDEIDNAVQWAEQKTEQVMRNMPSDGANVGGGFGNGGGAGTGAPPPQGGGNGGDAGGGALEEYRYNQETGQVERVR